MSDGLEVCSGPGARLPPGGLQPRAHNVTIMREVMLMGLPVFELHPDAEAAFWQLSGALGVPPTAGLLTLLREAGN